MCRSKTWKWLNQKRLPASQSTTCGAFLCPYMTYTEQMNQKGWKNKRVEILIRDQFKCQHNNCGAQKRLEVHHLDYIDDTLIWNYPNDMLITLCHKHHSVEQNRNKAEIALVFTLRMKGFLLSDLLSLSCKIDNNVNFTETLLKVLRDA